MQTTNEARKEIKALREELKSMGYTIKNECHKIDEIRLYAFKKRGDTTTTVSYCLPIKN